MVSEASHGQGSELHGPELIPGTMPNGSETTGAAEPNPPAQRGGEGLPPGNMEPIAFQSDKPKMSPNEIAIMKSCDREAFLVRGVPLGLISGALTLAAIRSGRLAAHPNFGEGPKVILIGLLGSMLGRLSYSNVCAERVLVEAPNSFLAGEVRKKRGLPALEDSDRAMSSAPEAPVPAPIPPIERTPKRSGVRNKYGDEVFE